jgi:hypothetical protein
MSTLWQAAPQALQLQQQRNVPERNQQAAAAAYVKSMLKVDKGSFVTMLQQRHVPEWSQALVYPSTAMVACARPCLLLQFCGDQKRTAAAPAQSHNQKTKTPVAPNAALPEPIAPAQAIVHSVMTLLFNELRNDDSLAAFPEAAASCCLCAAAAEAGAAAKLASCQRQHLRSVCPHRQCCC